MLLVVERPALVYADNETREVFPTSHSLMSIYQCIFSRVSVTISKLFSRKKAVIFQIALKLRGDIDDLFQKFAEDRQQGYRPVVWGNMLIPILENWSYAYGGLYELFGKAPTFDRGIEECRNWRGDDGGKLLEDWSRYSIRSRCFRRVKVFQEWADFSGIYRAETFKKATIHNVSMVYFACR